MQLNAALPPSQVSRCVAAISRRVLSRSVGLTSFGARRTPSVLSRLTSTVCVGRPSFGGRRKVSGDSRSGVFGVAEVLQSSRCWSRSARATCPSAVIARLRFVQAPRSTARCPSATALPAKPGHSHAQHVLLSPACCVASTCFAIGIGTLFASVFACMVVTKAMHEPSEGGVQ